MRVALGGDMQLGDGTQKKRTQLLTQAWPLPTDFPGRAGELADLQHRWTEQEGL